MHKIKKNVLQGAEDQGSEGDEEDKDEDYHMQATHYVNLSGLATLHLAITSCFSKSFMLIDIRLDSVFSQ